MIILSLIHDFWLGQRMMDRLEQARATAAELPIGPDRPFVQWAAGIILVLYIWIVTFAIWMTRP